MAPLVRRQVLSLISEALESRVSTASTALFSTTPVVADPIPTLVQSTTPVVVQPPVETSLDTLTQTTFPTTSSLVPQAPIPTNTPTISVIVITTTTSDPVTTTLAVTSSTDPIASTTPDSTLVLTTPIPEVINVPTTSISVVTPSASASGVAAGAGTGAESQSNKGMSGGIIALIVVGVLLATLLAGAFTFRRIQVRRRTKRRENNYGAGPIPDDAPFPFTNVSETDLKGAEPIRDVRQNSVTSLSEKPLPSIAPVMPTYVSNFNQAALNGNMSGPYPIMGPNTYGYGQPNRTASPAPSQAPRIMSPSVPPLAVLRTASPALSVTAPPTQYPKSLTPGPPPVPAPAATLAPVEADALPPHMRGRKRVVQTFQPSMSDELDIREGDWVTIIHAFDDGWCMCERSGRRGVVPLECLDVGKPDFRASRRLSSLSAIRS